MDPKEKMAQKPYSVTSYCPGEPPYLDVSRLGRVTLGVLRGRSTSGEKAVSLGSQSLD